MSPLEVVLEKCPGGPLERMCINTVYKFDFRAFTWGCSTYFDTFIDHSWSYHLVSNEDKFISLSTSFFTWMDCGSLKMLYLIGPHCLINRGFVNFQKMVWMTMVHVLRFRTKDIHLDWIWSWADTPSVYKVCRIYQVFMVLSQIAS